MVSDDHVIYIQKREKTCNENNVPFSHQAMAVHIHCENATYYGFKTVIPTDKSSRLTKTTNCCTFELSS